MSEQIILENDTQVKVEIKKPPKYNVVFYNDDFTPFVFVEFILTNIFNKSLMEAEQIANKIHKEGKSIVSTYPKEIANTKKYLVDTTSKEYNYPLRCEVESE